jgi:succinate-semialdehyde dehydrogenase/glutarate-semialdehyde dehydrogenase
MPESATGIAYNPATLQPIGSYELTPVDALAGIVAEARAAQPAWAAVSVGDRASRVLAARRFLIDHAGEIAAVIHRDNGKPTLEALTTEVVPAIDLMGYFAHHTESILADEPIRIHNPFFFNKRSYLKHQPRGVVAVIAPWNYPFSIPMGEVVMALMAGNAVVLKGSSLTPLVAKEIGRVMAAAELPPGVFTVVQGGGSTVGSALARAKVDKISFTGSVGVGREIMRLAAENLTPVKLELGGKDPAIVCADADVERAANGVIWGAFMNCGQTCASVERVYVHDSVADEFIDRVVQGTRALRVGWAEDDSVADVDVGPMTSEDQLELVRAHVADAVRRGATVLAGGGRPDSVPEERLPGWFFAPTVLTNVTREMDCLREETFGPTLPIVRVSSDEEALRLANHSPYGLTASVWTRSRARGRFLAEQVRAGVVTVNDCVYSHGIAETPWTGVGWSGFGSSHGAVGLRELCVPQHVNYDVMPLRRNLWWYPYGPFLGRLLGGFLRVLGGADRVTRPVHDIAHTVRKVGGIW